MPKIVINRSGRTAQYFVEDLRLLRGGSWNNNPEFCRSAYRSIFVAGNRYNDLGFRVVCAAAWIQ